MTMSPTTTVAYIGCAGWSIPSQYKQLFPEQGTHLVRYAQRLLAAEINSSFYRPHRPETYARWALSVPDTFRFAVKMPKEITHVRRLVDSAGLLEDFLSQTRELGPKLGPLLVQLPPSLRFDSAIAESFFATLRNHFGGDVVCEPRHPSWFTDTADCLLKTAQVARVAADPAPVPAAAQPGGWPNLVYYRLHGSPKIYESAYSEAFLEALAEQLRAAAQTATTWCIFDNTALGAAIGNALDVWTGLHRVERTSRNYKDRKE